jgi:hypothetical protein
LLQFFLNHRRYLRSEDPTRVGKSPAELLTGEPHARWLELLGYTRFSHKATGRIEFTCDTVLCGLRHVDRVYRYVDRVYRSGQSGRGCHTAVYEKRR